MDAYDLFKQASMEWEKGKKKVAFDLFLKAAELGEPSAQHNVGYFYDEGEGVRKNRKLALHWYLKAWKGDRQTGTCINIAKLYAEAKDVKHAVSWWSKAIKAGDGDAALDLAKFYLRSDRKDARGKARPLLKKAINSRHVSEEAVTEARQLLAKLNSKVERRS